MSDSPTIHRFAPHEWRSYRELRLRALADSPDAFGSTLELESVRPDAEWARQLEDGARSPSDLPLVARLDDETIGLAWGRIQATEPAVAYLFQVWVAPEHRGRGVARMLLDAVVAWAQEAGPRYLALEVTCGDSAAVRLYTRAGFSPSGDPRPLRPGSPLMTQPMRLALRR
jgi:ribosomal protein S18 acetylase RimI-like enzyme